MVFDSGVAKERVRSYLNRSPASMINLRQRNTERKVKTSIVLYEVVG